MSFLSKIVLSVFVYQRKTLITTKNYISNFEKSSMWVDEGTSKAQSDLVVEMVDNAIKEKRRIWKAGAAEKCIRNDHSDLAFDNCARRRHAKMATVDCKKMPCQLIQYLVMYRIKRELGEEDNQ